MDMLAKKIKETRKIKGLTQEQLAEISLVNLRTIQRIENNESIPRESTLKLICDALEIEMKEFLIPEETDKKNSIPVRIANGFFLVVLNMILMLITGFATLSHDANLNSIVGGVLLSFFIPFFIVVYTKNMSGIERFLKFGSGYIIYFFLLLIIPGFKEGLKAGVTTGFFACLFISLSVFYFGNVFFKNNRD